MTYLVIGRDYKDGLERRLVQRDAHLAGANKLKAEGKLLYAVAIKEEGKMVGSVMVMNFANDEEMEEWRVNEPYITGKVWEFIEITEGAVAPMFA